MSMTGSETDGPGTLIDAVTNWGEAIELTPAGMGALSPPKPNEESTEYRSA